VEGVQREQTVTPADLVIELAEVNGYAVLVLWGSLTVDSATQARAALHKLVLDRAQVLVDVSGLRSAWPPVLALFPSILSASGGWPVARMVLVGADERLRWALGAATVSTAVPVAESSDEAAMLIQRRPALVRRHRAIAPSLKASQVARAMGREVCRDWEIENLALPVTAIAAELVSNAVEHTGGACTLGYMLDRLGMHIAVRDHRPATGAEVSAIRSPAQWGHGLSLVKSLARGWGVTRDHDGKTVWGVVLVS